MSDKLTTLVTGFFGVSAIEATPLLMASVPSPEEITRIGQVLVQIAIGIVTLYRLLKGQSAPVETKKDEENNTPA
jgi:hypothetical protein